MRIAVACFAWLFSGALLAQLPLSPPPQERSELVNVGGVMLALPVPAGFAAVPASHAELTRLGEHFTAPQNRLLAFMVTSADLQQFSGAGARFERYFLVQTAKAAEAMSMPRADFAQVRGVLRAQQDELFRRLAPDAQQLYRDISKNLSRDYGTSVELKIGDLVPLGIFEEAPAYITFGIMSKVEGQAAGRKEAVDVMCVTSLVNARGKVVFLYAYANPKKPKEAAWAKQASRDWVAAFLRLNP